VPNICVGVVDLRTKLRLFFPALYDPDNPTVELDLEHKTAIYEDGLRPCLEVLNPDTLTNWPVNYEGALTRAQKTDGRYQYSTRPFPAVMVERLGHELRRQLAAMHPWARDMLFMVQIQGVKEANQHRPDDPDDAMESVFTLMNDLDIALLQEPHCWIDVGLEISDPGHAFQWMTDAHHILISHFTSMTPHQAAGYVNRPARSYSRDVAAGLPHLSGFRATFELNRRDPVYIQAYTTDKALIYQL
ncbi:hypothetical protein M405DRAFT_710294, partial [Rhizopogon salebrosus TDB-379]